MSTQHEILALGGNWTSDFDQNQILFFSEQDWLPKTPTAICKHPNLDISFARPAPQAWNESVDDVIIANRFGGCQDFEAQHDGAVNLYVDFSQHEQALPHANHNPADMVRSFQKHFQGMGKAEDRKSVSNLLRGALPVRGVKMLQIRYELHRWYRERIQASGPVPVCVQKDFAFLLIESNWYEDKVAAVLFMQEVLICKQHISFLDLPRFEAMFRGDHIRVYKVCDHFAEKVLGHLAGQSEQKGEQFEKMMDVLFAWTHADNLWQSRAAMHVLINYANHVNLHEQLMESVKMIIKRPEEEAKSISGAMLRSISDADPVIVIEFLNEPSNMQNMSVLALQKATSRFTTEQKQQFRILRRTVIANKLYC